MKNSMKAIMTVLISICSMSLMAQPTTGGIYLTVQDFKAHKLSYVLNDGDKLQLNQFLNSGHISLVYQGKKVKLQKADIFGYRLNNRDYRFFNNEAYNVLDTAGFMLYSCTKLTPQVKGYKPVTQYFFSAGADKPVLDLTMENLAISFRDQTDFEYSLQSYFSNNANLMAYDRLAGQYKIKYLFMQQKHVLAAHNINKLN